MSNFSRRNFLKTTALFAGGTGMANAFPMSIQALERAMAINPEPGSTYEDAEHVVVLMQENRSFDHCFGSLKGVRGFNDPRVMTQPNNNVTWLQSTKKGRTYLPFRFDIEKTKATWTGSIPHSRHSQVDANNYGRYDNWLESKRSGNKGYKDIPLTLGYYNRADLPFHYSFADAFTVCDQNFCSGMTSTWPNRFFLWSGSVRAEQSDQSRAIMRNYKPYDFNINNWKTFPETLEEEKISWKVYQNSLTMGGGLKEEERSWMGNFGCNPLEFYPQFNSRFFDRYYKTLQRRVKKLPKQIAEAEEKIKKKETGSKDYKKLEKKIKKKKAVLAKTKQELEDWSPDDFKKLTDFQKNLYNKAFTINDDDPDFMELAELKYNADGEEKKTAVPKGDILYQFRKDVDSGELPTVSWLIPPRNFSDHPTSPWYGAWYTSEILNILTKNPEVWKKTIFILTYDENDGYFDHIPPYVAPDPNDLATGKTSSGLNRTGAEFIRREQEIKGGVKKKKARTAPTGLGFRVPMVIASPWSRGGKVCSQVFDHTSVLQFLEKFLNKKFDTHLRVNNISDWRRTITGDLTAVFDKYDVKKDYGVDFVDRDNFIKMINKAKFREVPNNYKSLSEAEISEVNKDPLKSSLLADQEKGTRVARPIPYQLYVNGKLNRNKTHFRLQMEAGKEVFGEESSGAPFKVYAPGEHKIAKTTYKNKDKETGQYQAARSWDYAVRAGGDLPEEWEIANFKNNQYHLRVYGPNGFYREFRGTKNSADLDIQLGYESVRQSKRRVTGNIIFKIKNKENKAVEINVKDESYGAEPVTRTINPEKPLSLTLNLKESSGWYDYSVMIAGENNFSQRFAGHVETGEESSSDPLMGGEIKETV